MLTHPTFDRDLTDPLGYTQPAAALGTTAVAITLAFFDTQALNVKKFKEGGILLLPLVYVTGHGAVYGVQYVDHRHAVQYGTPYVRSEKKANCQKKNGRQKQPLAECIKTVSTGKKCRQPSFHIPSPFLVKAHGALDDTIIVRLKS